MRKFLLSFTVFALTPVGNQSAEAQWDARAWLVTEGQYDTNPLLLPDGEDDVFGLTVSPGVRLERTTRTTTFHVAGSVTYFEFTGSGREAEGFDDLDTFDQHADAGLAFEGARDTLDANVRFDRATTRTTEVEDTGVLSTDTRRISYGGDANYGLGLSSVDTLEFIVEGRNVTYSDGVLVDFATYGGGLAFRRRINPIDEVGASVLYTRFDPEQDVFSDTNIVTGSVDWIREESAAFSTTLSVGATYVDIEEAGAGATAEDDSAVRPYLLALLDWTPTPTDLLSLSLESSVQGSGTGSPQHKFRAGVDYSHQFTRAVTFDLRTAAIVQESVDESVSDERTYFEISPGVSWRLPSDLLLSAKYRFRQQEFEEVDDAATSHAIFVTLTYNVPSLLLF